MYPGPKCDRCHKKVSPDEMVVCAVCNNHICIDCYDANVAMILTSNQYRVLYKELAMKFKSIDTKYSDCVCDDCVIKLEKDVITSIPKDELPLFINTTFYTDEGEAFYHERLGMKNESK